MSGLYYCFAVLHHTSNNCALLCSEDLNFSSNVLFEIHGAGSQEAAMIKSVGSVFENNIVADSTLGHLMNLSPFL
eukprot:COSAG05_NODE_37_length_27688_cov_18.080394_14_plen_75_part_00